MRARIEIASGPGDFRALRTALMRRCEICAGGGERAKIDLLRRRRPLQMLEVDRYGFDEVDRKLLLDDYRKVSGRAGGLSTLARCWPRTGCDRRNLRTISDADWIFEPHSTGASGDATGIRTFWHYAEPKAEFVVLKVHCSTCL